MKTKRYYDKNNHEGEILLIHNILFLIVDHETLLTERDWPDVDICNSSLLLLKEEEAKPSIIEIVISIMTYAIKRSRLY